MKGVVLDVRWGVGLVRVELLGVMSITAVEYYGDAVDCFILSWSCTAVVCRSHTWDYLLLVCL